MTDTSTDDRLIRRFSAEFEQHGALLPVRHRRSGKRYTLEQDVFEANAKETRPYVYVWPKSGRRRDQPVWCYLASLDIDEDGGQSQ